MNAQYSIELPHAFVVGKEDLKKLARLLIDRIGNLDIRADCADDISRHFRTVNDLIAYENPKAKEIIRIHLFARSEDFSKWATIDLSGSRWRGISLDFTAREDVVSRLRAETLDILSGMRPWYDAVHRINLPSVALYSFVILTLMNTAIQFDWLPISSSNSEGSISPRFVQVAGICFVAFIIGLSITLEWFQGSIFPRAVFKIGQAESRFMQLERFQWGVVIAFAVSLASSLAITIWQMLTA